MNEALKDPEGFENKVIIHLEEMDKSQTYVCYLTSLL